MQPWWLDCSSWNVWIYLAAYFCRWSCESKVSIGYNESRLSTTDSRFVSKRSCNLSLEHELASWRAVMWPLMNQHQADISGEFMSKNRPKVWETCGSIDFLFPPQDKKIKRVQVFATFYLQLWEINSEFWPFTSHNSAFFFLHLMILIICFCNVKNK